MMTNRYQVDSTQTNYPFFLPGLHVHAINDAEFAQDSARVTGTKGDILAHTVVSKIGSADQWVPLTEVLKAETAAKAVCGANGGNLAAWQAVGDGEFSIDIDGTTRDVTGIVTTAVVALIDLPGIIAAAISSFAFVEYDALGDVFTFVSKATGIASTISVLSAVSGGAGTDISGSGFLNGTAATLTQGTGYDGSEIPLGILLEGISDAAIAAADVSGVSVAVMGPTKFDASQIVLDQGTLTLASVVGSQNLTVGDLLRTLGFIAQDTKSRTGLQS